MSYSASLLVIEDSDLVARSQQGDTDAFGELVRRYQLDVRAFLRRRLNDNSVADDLAQDVFLGAMKSIAKFRETSSVRSWLISIARYKLIDHYRLESRGRDLKTELEFALEAENLRRVEESGELDESVVDSLKNCIDRLQPKAQLVLQKYYFDGVDAKTIASNSKQKPSTVRMSLLRIRKALGKCIKKSMGDKFQL